LGISQYGSNGSGHFMSFVEFCREDVFPPDEDSHFYKYEILSVGAKLLLKLVYRQLVTQPAIGQVKPVLEHSLEGPRVHTDGYYDNMKNLGSGSES
jgi:hypothetical protein